MVSLFHIQINPAFSVYEIALKNSDPSFIENKDIYRHF